MRAERMIDAEPDRVWMVAHWKYDLDSRAHWWQKLFFRLYYRPFIHVAFHVFGIPAVKGAEVEGGRTTFLWFENAGFFSSEDAADIACTTQYHGYKDVPLDRRFPNESCQYSSLVFPRQKNPRQHRKTPTFSIIAKDRRQDEKKKRMLVECLEQVNQVLSK